MGLGFVISWIINFIIVSVLLAILDEHKKYYMENKPWFLFLMALLVPTLLEILSFFFNNTPFMVMLLPIENWTWLF